MKYYPVVLIIIRFFAVTVALYCLYTVTVNWFSDLFALFSSDVVNADAARIWYSKEHWEMMSSLRGVLASVVIYFGAPFLARAIIWKSEG